MGLRARRKKVGLGGPTYKNTCNEVLVANARLQDVNNGLVSGHAVVEFKSPARAVCRLNRGTGFQPVIGARWALLRI